MSNAQTSSFPNTFAMPFPTPPSSTNTTPSLDTQPSTLPTPPSSIRSPSPNTTMPPPPAPAGPKRSESRRSVQFPSNPTTASFPESTPTHGPDASTTATAASDRPTRQRYHSGLTRPTVSRNESDSAPPPPKTFTGKLQSLRKKIENELSRKRGQPGGGGQGQGQTPSQQSKKNKKAQKGTVAGLRPSPALTVPEGMSVADASQLCAAKRTDCVLVVDEEEGLSGIFTAKDLAFRVSPANRMRERDARLTLIQVAAESLDPRTTTVAQIMTKNPMVTRDTTSATEALQLMVSRHFRHLVSGPGCLRTTCGLVLNGPACVQR